SPGAQRDRLAVARRAERGSAGMTNQTAAIPVGAATPMGAAILGVWPAGVLPAGASPAGPSPAGVLTAGAMTTGPTAAQAAAPQPGVAGTGVIRTCVGCRSRAARSDLLRIVVVGGELVPDVRRRLPGRGAHVHPDLACVELAERRRAFPRALRVPGPLGLE